MSFKQFGGLTFAAKNNIIGNLYSTTGNLGISSSLGQENSKIISQSHVDLSGNSLMHIGSLYFMDGSVQTTAQQTSPSGAAIFNSGIIVSNGATIDTLHVTGTSQLDGAVTMGSTLGVTGLVTTNALTANGLILANGGLTSTAGTTALGTTTIDTGTSLTLTGIATLTTNTGLTTIVSGGLISTAGATALGATTIATGTSLTLTGTAALTTNTGLTTIGSGGLTSTAGTTALGTTTTTTLTASGLSSLNGDVNIGGVPNQNYLQFPTGNKQYDAYTLPNPAPTQGSYTNANITVNSAGQITSASNGTIITQFVPQFYNVGATQYTTTLGGYLDMLDITFTGVWGVVDYVVFRVQQSSIWDNGTQGITHGYIYFKPYYMPAGVWSGLNSPNLFWANGTGNQYGINNAVYYVPSGSVANNGLLYIFGLDKNCNFMVNSPSSPDGFASELTLEYMGRSVNGGSVSISQGNDGTSTYTYNTLP